MSDIVYRCSGRERKRIKRDERKSFFYRGLIILVY